MKATRWNALKKRGLILAGIAIVTFTGLGIIFFQHFVPFRQKFAYLQTLQGLAFNKYLNLPAGYSSMSHLGNWDDYLYTASEFQCVLGGHYLLLAHAGIESDKTVIWLLPGQEY